MGMSLRSTYVCGGVLLVSAEDGTAALSGVEGTLALDGGLAVGTRATGLAADLGDGVPVAHCGGVAGCVMRFGIEDVVCLGVKSQVWS